MTICRTIHNKNYTIINNTISRDKRLSMKAKGIWMYAFSRPDDWSFYVSDISNQCTDGKDSIKSGLIELEECGYLQRSQIRDEYGQFTKFEYHFFEIPQELKKCLPEADFPLPDKPLPENPPLLSNDCLLNNENNNPPQAVVVSSSEEKGNKTYECLDQLKIPDTLKSKITQEFSLEQASVATKRCTQWVGRPNDSVGVMTALNKSDQWLDKPNPTESIDDNIKYLKSICHLDLTKIGICHIAIGKDYIEFSCGSNSKFFDITQKNFISDVSGYLEKLKHT